jgi:hypothetical protein
VVPKWKQTLRINPTKTGPRNRKSNKNSSFRAKLVKRFIEISIAHRGDLYGKNKSVD